MSMQGPSTEEVYKLLLTGQAASQERDLDRAFHWVTGAATSLLEAPLVAIVLTGTSDGDRPDVFGKIGGVPISQAAASVLSELAAASWPLDRRSGRTIVLQKNDLPAVVTNWGINHLVQMPISTIQQACGALIVGRQQPWELNPRNQFILNTIANQAAIALKNDRLHREIQERIERLDAFNRICRAATSTLDLEDVFRLLSSEAQRVIPHDRAVIALIDPGAETATVYASAGRQAILGKGTAIPIHGSMVGQVFKSGQGAFKRDFEQEADFVERLGLLALGIRSSVMVPLWDGNRCFGTLSFGSQQAGKYGPDELALTQEIADQIAVAIVNSRLYEALQASEERFRKIFDYSNDAIFVIDLERDEIVDANPGASTMLGYSQDELRSMRISAIHPGEMPKLIAFAQSVIEQGRGWTDELTCLTRSGETLPAEISASMVDIDGRTCMIALIRDTTERREAERALRESEERFRTVVEQAADALMITDIQGNLTDVNQMACDSLGYTREELLRLSTPDFAPCMDMGKTAQLWTQVLPAPDLATDLARQDLAAAERAATRIAEAWREQGRPTTSVTLEETFQRKDGTTFPVELRVGLIELDGRPFYVTLARDITERKRAEERIRREAARADALARVAARLNAHLTLDDVLQAVCEETARALDVPAAVVLLHDETCGELFLAADIGLPPDYREDYTRVPRSLYDQFAQEKGRLLVETDLQAIPNLPNAGLYVRHNIRSAVATSMIREGHLMGLLNIYTLGEERIFNEEELALLQGLADQAAQAIENARLRERAKEAAVSAERSRLARDLHDSVSQSLYGVNLYAEATARLLEIGHTERATAQLREMRDTAQEALREMRLLIYELRPPVLEDEGLVAALQDRLEAVEERAGIKTSFRTDLQRKLSPEIEEDLYRIAQEALNNALKHARAQNISIDLHQADSSIILEIADDGAGFDPHTITDKRGLGLRGMQERTAQLQGTLTVTSQPATGTIIRIEVPND